MKRVFLLSAIASCVVFGSWLGWSIPIANAQSQPSAWIDMGEANGVQAFRFTDAGRVCYVTTPAGGIACVR